MSSQLAPSLNAHQIKKSLKAKSKKPVRNTLCTPFKVVWPAVDGSVQDGILTELKKTFSVRNLRNPSAENSKYRRLKKAERQIERDQILSEFDQTPEEINIRSQLVFGVQEVTRRLEKNELRLVIVDRSSPWQLHRHLALLSAVRGCPALAIDRLSDTVAPLVSLTRLSAFAFKMINENDSNYLNATVDFVASRIASVDIPWLECEMALQALKEEQLETEEEIVVDEEEKLKPDNEETINEKDFSHLYVYRPLTTSSMPVCSAVSFSTVIDDMWGINSKGKRTVAVERKRPRLLTGKKRKLRKTDKRNDSSGVYKELNIGEVQSKREEKKKEKVKKGKRKG